jgi:hypothetical protein
VNLALERVEMALHHLVALALWLRIGGVLGVLAAVRLFLLGGQSGTGEYSRAISGMAMGIGVGVLVGSALSFVLGHFLARHHNWARITAGTFAALGLALFVIVFGLGIYALATAPSIPEGMYSYHEGPSVFGVLGRGALSILWMSAVTWAYFNRRAASICTERYRHVVAATPTVKPATFKSLFFVIPCLLLTISLGLAGILLLSGRQF